jgi:hypothetical protein
MADKLVMVPSPTVVFMQYMAGYAKERRYSPRWYGEISSMTPVYGPAVLRCIPPSRGVNALSPSFYGQATFRRGYVFLLRPPVQRPYEC